MFKSSDLTERSLASCDLIYNVAVLIKALTRFFPFIVNPIFSVLMALNVEIFKRNVRKYQQFLMSVCI